jgi:hypothetical protein
MGGLISNLLTIDSGEDFWKIVSDTPFDRVNMSPEVRQDLQQTFFFRRENYVKRVIFIGTPHRGSKLSPSPLGRLAVHLAQMPSELKAIRANLVKDNPNMAKVLHDRALPTSVDLLAPGAPALQLMANRPRPQGVHYHTIAGDISSATTKIEFWLACDSGDKGDGVVPYSSAHLDVPTIAESEKVVPADHFHVHHHPLAIQEVRRILMEHYQMYIRQQDADKELQLTGSGTDRKPPPSQPQSH